MDLKQRSLKISIGAVLAIILAQALGLQNPFSAGIVTLLSVLDTRLASLQTGITRFLSNILAFALASFIFVIFGFTVWAFGIFLLVYVPAAYLLKLEAGISPSSVLVTHFIAAKSIAWSWQFNGLSLMAIGIVVALVLNIWMPNQAKSLESLIVLLEEQLRGLLRLISKELQLEVGHNQASKKAMAELDQTLDRFKLIAHSEYANQLVARNHYYVKYAEMRQEQMTILKRIHEEISLITLQTEQSQILAEMFEITANELAESNNGLLLLEKLRQLYVIYRDSQLPQDRQEFENRAILYHILVDFERFLEIKRAFYCQHVEVSQRASQAVN